MKITRNITDDIVWVGADDRRISLFENLFPVTKGVSYNSYLILDEKTALLDTADMSVAERFLRNVEETLGDRPLDYVIINHMEPDHCASLAEVRARYPRVRFVGNARTQIMARQFFGDALADNFLIIKEGETLSLGKHELTFLMAPMVHWPEVMVTYDRTDKALFSADAFGAFGATNGNLFADEIDAERDWLPEARRYYANIVGKYGAQVQKLLAAAAKLDLRIICPLHGVVWRENLAYLLEKYDRWSKYEPEEKTVAVFYGSVYGHTEAAAQALATRLADGGVKKIAMYDVSTTPVDTLIAETWRVSHIVLAATTYNMNIYPPMERYLLACRHLNVQNRTFAVVENGSWAPAAGALMRKYLEEMKHVTVLEGGFTIVSSAEASADKIETLAVAVRTSLGL